MAKPKQNKCCRCCPDFGRPQEQLHPPARYDVLPSTKHATCSCSRLRLAKKKANPHVKYTRQVEAKYPDQIKVFYSSTCDSIELTSAGIEVRASVRGSGSEGEGVDKKVFRPRLLVGADGLKSMVGGTAASGRRFGGGNSRQALNYCGMLLQKTREKGTNCRCTFAMDEEFAARIVTLGPSRPCNAGTQHVNETRTFRQKRSQRCGRRRDSRGICVGIPDNREGRCAGRRDKNIETRSTSLFNLSPYLFVLPVRASRSSLFPAASVVDRDPALPRTRRCGPPSVVAQAGETTLALLGRGGRGREGGRQRQAPQASKAGEGAVRHAKGARRFVHTRGQAPAKTRTILHYVRLA